MLEAVRNESRGSVEASLQTEEGAWGWVGDSAGSTGTAGEPQDIPYWCEGLGRSVLKQRC